MRILIVTQYFWPESFRVNDLAAGLRDLGHEVEILTGQPNYPAGRLFPGYQLLKPLEERYERMRVVRVPLVTRGRSKGFRLAMNYLSFALAACLLGPWRCSKQIDAVLIYQPSPVTVALPGLLIARLRRARSLLWIQDLWPDTLAAMGFSDKGRLMRCATALSDFIHRRCDRLLVQSPAFTGSLLERDVAADRIAYLPNWAESFYRPKADAPGNTNPLRQISGFKIVFAGNIGSAQSFETILGAADQLREIADLNWVIIGDGLMRDSVAASVKELGLDDRIHLLGQRPPEEMPGCFAHADVLLVTLRPDPVFALTIPSKIQSYLACGKPIIASMDGAGAEVIRESGAGEVSAAGDADGLARAVVKLHRMSAVERESRGALGRKYYEQNFERGLLLSRLDRWIRETKTT